jgi:predicted phage gp36 major capsid-like protein
MMDLRTVKEIAKLKAQVGPLQRQYAERLNAAVGQAKSTAVAEFKNHFMKGGFTVVGEAKRYAATYESMQFVLEIAETRGALSFCEFHLVPPTLLNEAKVTVHMIRKGPPLTGRPLVADHASLLLDAERDLAEARAALVSSAPEFCFTVVEEENAELPAVDVVHNDMPVFDTFGEFLVSVYPQ